MADKKVWIPTPKQKEALQLGSLLRTLGCVEGQLGSLRRQLYDADLLNPGTDSIVGRAAENVHSLKQLVRQVSIFTAHRNKQEKEQES